MNTRYRVNEKGKHLLQRFNIINDTIEKYKEGNKDILKNIIIDWDWNEKYKYEILKKIIEGNGRKIKSYGFTVEDLKYVFEYPDMVWPNMQEYFEKVD
jgi:hypothetical protein